MEWDLINYFSEKLYIEHKNQSLILIKEKVFSLRVHQNLKTTTNEIGKRKIILVKSQLTPAIPPHSIQWSVISPRHFLPRPLLSSRNGAKTFFWNQFPGTVNYESFFQNQKAWKLKFIEKRGWGLSTLLVMVSVHSWVGQDINESGLFRLKFRFTYPDHFQLKT